MLTHLSLFSGIGGLDLAAEWAGFTTVGQCEWADYPTKVLEKHWPDVPRWRDIRTLNWESFHERTGLPTVDLISGGFPCQPFSVAGKQKGKGDDRYLWPEMLRVIRELAPRWVFGENVPGILRIAAADVVQDLEREGYNVAVFDFEAAAVGAPHRRERIAFIGERASVGNSGGGGLHRFNGWRSGTQFEDGHAQHPAEQSLAHLHGFGNDDGTDEVHPAEGGFDAQRRTVRRCEDVAGQTVVNPDAEGLQGKQQHGTPDAGDQRQSKPCRPVSEPGEAVFHATSEGLSHRTGEPMGRYGTQEPEPQRSDSMAAKIGGGSTIWHAHSDDASKKQEMAGRSKSDGPCGGSENGEGTDRRTGPVEPRLGGMAYGLSRWLDEPDIPRVTTGVKNRADRLKCLGNAVVPQWAYPIFKAIAEAEHDQRR